MTKHKSKKAKLERPRSGEDLDEQSALTPSISTTQNEPTDSQSISTRVSFIPEVTAMLYAYGDVRHPLNETAVLVEEIVYQQICQLLKAGAEVASMRSSPELGLEEFLFLLRKNGSKLSRFSSRMKFLDTHPKKIFSSSNQENEDVVKTEEEDPEDLLHSGENKKMDRWKVCYDFLSTIDETGELMEAINKPFTDDIKIKRMERAEKQTRDMDADEYMEYVKCRQISFASMKNQQKKRPRFRDWFDFDAMQLDILPSAYGWDALEYLAQETVGELVDMALLVRSENILPLLPSESEPNSRHMPIYASSSLIDRAEVLRSASAANVKQERDPEGIPAPDSGSGAKRRKTEDGGASGEVTSHSLNRKLALTPFHVREALRRFSNVNTTKTFLSKTMTLSTTEPITKLLCLS